jgi:hypothetical protein
MDARDYESIAVTLTCEGIIFRNEAPHYKISCVKGDCGVYCCQCFEYLCLVNSGVDQALEVVG